MTTCRICDNSDTNPAFRVPEMMFGSGETFQYFQCSRCGCLQIEEIPSDMSRYYGPEYYAYSNEIEKKVFKPVEYARHLRNEYAVFDRGVIGRFLYAIYPRPELRVLSIVSVRKDMRILDVGCGYGKLLGLLHCMGFTNVAGVDPFIKENSPMPKGFPIHRKRLEEMEGNWDLIMFHESFEHIPDGYTALRTVHHLLDTAGRCILAMPTVNSYAWERYGVNWVQIDAPRHCFVHSIESLRRLAEKAGFIIAKTEYNSTAFQFWGSEQYEHGIPLMAERSYARSPRDSMFSTHDIRKFKIQAHRLNAESKGDQIAVALRKR